MAKIFSFVLLVAVLAYCKGDSINKVSRVANINRYFLYTRNNKVVPIELERLVPDNNIVLNRTTVFLVHGHGGTATTTLNSLVKNELLEITEDVNVIVVDWSEYASLSYSNADRHLLNVATYFVDFLVIQGFNSRPETIHLVGFDLGAHIVGLTGRRFPNIARITALDPSKSSYRLQKTDAIYVEVIHTDGNGLFSNGLGTQLGDLDFFPNGGNSQPGCLSNSCDHNRAWQFFAASQRLNTFLAHCCNSMTQMKYNSCRGGGFIQMGGNTLLPKTGCDSGILRVNTGRTYPY
ncbi:inactive pancreatic lipase-related protein 1-like [Galleria mellonella]|uniref:Inactive pancreatic lipase-related protein 1-like n=1 Tax=Galleria mellonella TaxID=7137 RepID=A0A6J1WE27_GALME|nr:inactive pancreatic lipase-related protein 1-like [Galleria mellonella]